MRALRVEWGRSSRRLGFVVRVVNHWTETPVLDTLQVSVLSGLGQPVAAPGGGARQPDGTYRFLELPPGDYPLEIEDAQAHWAFFAGLPVLTLPLADPAESSLVVEVRAWPKPARPTPPAVTFVRGRLQDAAGEPIPGGKVALAGAGGPWSKATWADSDGEFVCQLSTFLAPNASGQLELETLVADGARSVVASTVERGPPDPGPRFLISPGRATRVRLEITP